MRRPDSLVPGLRSAHGDTHGHMVTSGPANQKKVLIRNVSQQIDELKTMDIKPIQKFCFKRNFSGISYQSQPKCIKINFLNFYYFFTFVETSEFGFLAHM